MHSRTSQLRRRLSRQGATKSELSILARDENDWDAVVLARAGLERLGLLDARTEINFEGQRFFLEILPCEIFLPAGGQGIVVLQVRSDDQSTKTIVDLINDRGTLLCLQAERE